jgi:hypothetical protein
MEVFSDDGSDENIMGMDGDSGQVLREHYFGHLVFGKGPLIVNVPSEQRWRLIISQVSSKIPAHFLLNRSRACDGCFQACLGESGAPDGCRVVLKAGVDQANTIVGHFRGGQVEHIVLGG